MINENLWSELFLGNKEYLLAHIKSFEHELDLLKNAIQNEDKKALQEFLGICIAEEKCIGSGAFRCAIKKIALAQNGHTLVYMPD